LWDADRASILGHAKRLEERAAELEKHAATLAVAVTLTVGLDAQPPTPEPPTARPVDPAEKVQP
jgi:hypothetical protein